MSVVVGGTKREFLRLSIECLLSTYKVQIDIVPCPGGSTMGRKVTFPVMNQIFVQIRVKGLFV